MTEVRSAVEAPLPNSPFVMPVNPSDATRMVYLAMQIAKQAVISDIESEAIRVDLDDYTWWDTRPMTDQREHSPPVVDMFSQAIQFAVGSGLAAVHPQRPYLITLVGRG